MASTMFLKLGDDPKFRGGCTASGHVGWIELSQFSWGWHGAHDGVAPRNPPGITEVNVGTSDAVGTTALFRACLDNPELPKVLVDLVPATGATIRFELQKVTVPSMSTVPDGDGKAYTSAVLRTERISMPTASAPAAARR